MPYQIKKTDIFEIKTVIVEMDPQISLYIKAKFQNCGNPGMVEFYKEIFDLFPSFEEIERA